MCWDGAPRPFDNRGGSRRRLHAPSPQATRLTKPARRARSRPRAQHRMYRSRSPSSDVIVTRQLKGVTPSLAAVRRIQQRRGRRTSVRPPPGLGRCEAKRRTRSQCRKQAIGAARSCAAARPTGVPSCMDRGSERVAAAPPRMRERWACRSRPGGRLLLVRRSRMRLDRTPACIHAESGSGVAFRRPTGAPIPVCHARSLDR
jgi:hypothetical protein